MLNAKCYFLPIAIIWLGHVFIFQLCCRRLISQFIQFTLNAGRYAIDIRSFTCYLLCLATRLVAEHGSYQCGNRIAHISPRFLRNATKDNVLVTILLHNPMHAALSAIRIQVGAELNGAARPVERIWKAAVVM